MSNYAFFGTSQNSNAIQGLTKSSGASGIVGRNESTVAGQGSGVFGYSDLSDGVRGLSNTGIGVTGYSGWDGIGGVLGEAADSGYGVRGISSRGIGVRASSQSGKAIEAKSFGTTPAVDIFANAAEGIYATTNAGSKAAIKGEANATGSMGVFGTSVLGYGVRGFSGGATGVSGSTNSGYGIIASANTGVGIRTSSTSGNALEVFGKLKIYGNAVNPQNGAVLTSDAEGNATWKLNKVGFRVGNLTSSIADETATTAMFAYEQYDYSNSFSLQTSTFTVPVTGVYSLGASMSFHYQSQFYNITKAYCTILISRGGTLHSVTSPFATLSKDQWESDATVNFSTEIKLYAGDVVWIRGWQANGNGETLTNWDGDFFGHLVFAE